MLSKKRILVCPLDWGLGHATRCIPIIKELERQNAEVIIAADKAPFDLLKKEFPENEFVVLPGYDISYPRNNRLGFKIFIQIPKILTRIKEEHKALQAIIKSRNIDAVISDNRYGLWSAKIPCVFITHQLMIKCPSSFKFLEPVLHKINLRYIKKYTRCWVPDFEAVENISGDLSHKYPVSEEVSFIGPLSRFTNEEFFTQSKRHLFDVLFLLSGPEPQRSVFEELILKQIENCDLKIALVRGLPGDKKSMLKGFKNLTVFNHLETAEMKRVILDSEFIICRPGYSTVMDLVTLGKKAAFVPTPGQTEQEYLATLYKRKGLFNFQNQNEFNLEDLISKKDLYKGLKIEEHPSDLKNAVEELLNIIPA